MSRKSQCGRSMIEMLGVLAIVGVLSVGGLVGYSKAMRANKINNAIEYFNRARLVFIERLITGNIDETVQCSNLLGEPMPSGVHMCKCLSGARRIYVRFKTVPLLKEFANRVSGEAGNDLIAHIDSELNKAKAVTELSIFWHMNTGKWWNTEP